MCSIIKKRNRVAGAKADAPLHAAWRAAYSGCLRFAIFFVLMMVSVNNLCYIGKAGGINCCLSIEVEHKKCPCAVHFSTHLGTPGGLN